MGSWHKTLFQLENLLPLDWIPGHLEIFISCRGGRKAEKHGTKSEYENRLHTKFAYGVGTGHGGAREVSSVLLTAPFLPPKVK